jgi:hypothetical protein
MERSSDKNLMFHRNIRGAFARRHPHRSLAMALVFFFVSLPSAHAGGLCRAINMWPASSALFTSTTDVRALLLLTSTSSSERTPMSVCRDLVVSMRLARHQSKEQTRKKNEVEGISEANQPTIDFRFL